MIVSGRGGMFVGFNVGASITICLRTFTAAARCIRAVSTLRKAEHFAINAPNLRQAGALIVKCSAFLSVDTALMHLAAAVKVRKQIVIEAPTLNPTNIPPRPDTIIVRNPAVAGRNLDFYRYDGGPIRGTDSEIRKLMESVTVDSVDKAVLSALST